MPPPPISHVNSAYCTYAYMYRRTCANAHVVSYVSSTCIILLSIYLPVLNTIIVLVRGWSPCTIILSLRYYMPNQASSTHLPYHNVNKFVLIVPNLPEPSSLNTALNIHSYSRCKMPGGPICIIFQVADIRNI